MLFKVDFSKDIFETLLGKNTSAFLFENGILFASTVGVDCSKYAFDTVKDIPLY